MIDVVIAGAGPRGLAGDPAGGQEPGGAGEDRCGDDGGVEIERVREDAGEEGAGGVPGISPEAVGAWGVGALGCAHTRRRSPPRLISSPSRSRRGRRLGDPRRRPRPARRCRDAAVAQSFVDWTCYSQIAPLPVIEINGAVALLGPHYEHGWFGMSIQVLGLRHDRCSTRLKLSLLPPSTGHGVSLLCAGTIHERCELLCVAQISRLLKWTRASLNGHPVVRRATKFTLSPKVRVGFAPENAA
jgi:hypothetical protein